MKARDDAALTMARVKAAEESGQTDLAFQLYLERQLSHALAALAAEGFDVAGAASNVTVPVERHIRLAEQGQEDRRGQTQAGRVVSPVAEAAYDLLDAVAAASALFYLGGVLVSPQPDGSVFNSSLLAMKAALLGEAGRALKEAETAARNRARAKKVAEARTGWHKPALAFAQERLALSPATSNRALARLIKDCEDVKLHQPPAVERILEVIPEWRKAGLLPPLARRGRHS